MVASEAGKIIVRGAPPSTRALFSSQVQWAQPLTNDQRPLRR